MVTNDEMSEVYCERQCTLRTPESHERQCLLLDGQLRSHFSTIYGINRRSILEDVPGFSVATALPHDIMHDLFEGVAKKEFLLIVPLKVILQLVNLTNEYNIMILFLQNFFD